MAGFHTTSRVSSSLYGAAQVHHHNHNQHNEKIKPYVQNDLGAVVTWRQVEEQHILIYGPLNEVAGTVFCTNSEYLFIHRCVYIY